MTVRGGVTDAVMLFSGQNVTMGWFPRISEFMNLRLFVYACSGRVGVNEFYPTANDLKLLPRTLKHIQLRCDAAEEAFFVNLISSARESTLSYQVGQLLNISALWPELVTLDIVQHEPNHPNALLQAFSIPLVKSLPATIERVGLRNYDACDADLFKALPRSLLHLRIENDPAGVEIDPSPFQYLPPNLQTYISAPYITGPPILSSTSLSQWGDLPRSLTFLCLFMMDASPELIEQLPPNLTYLNLGEGVSPPCYNAVSSTFRKLLALVVNDLSPQGWTKEYTGTMHLRHISRVTNDYFPGPAYFHTFDETSEEWQPVPNETRFQYENMILHK
jgi:hypothetical protein